MKTLYTGHITIDTHDVYTFIYAEEQMEAEKHLTALLNHYIRDHHSPTPTTAFPIKIVSRPQGWEPPDGYYLPGTSSQYSMKYPSHKPPTSQLLME